MPEVHSLRVNIFFDVCERLLWRLIRIRSGKVELWGSECHEICKSVDRGGVWLGAAATKLALDQSAPLNGPQCKSGRKQFLPVLAFRAPRYKNWSRAPPPACNLCVPLSGVSRTNISKQTHTLTRT